MKIGITKPVEVDAKTLAIQVKCTDYFDAGLLDQDNKVIHEVSGENIPSFFPGQHYGDYLILSIDIDTGQITNWQPPTAEQIQEWIKSTTE